MSKKPWFPFIIDDWWGSTRVRLMGADARDLYLDCLCRQWKDGAIPTDPKALAAILPGGRTAASIGRLWPKVAPHFEPAADGLVANPKLAALRRKAHAVSEVRSAAGKLGGRPKASATADAEAHAEADAFAEPEQTGTHSETRSQKLETEGKGLPVPSPGGPLALLGDTPSPTRGARRSRGTHHEAKSAATWDAYAAAYADRYGRPPDRSAQANSLLCQVVDRIGAEKAPLVAAFYLTHARRVYVEGGHPLELLLRDCRWLATQWATGRVVTQTQARQTDQTGTNAETLRVLLAERAAREGDRR